MVRPRFVCTSLNEPLPPPPLSVHRVHYILDGQHKFTALCGIRDKLLAEGKVLPGYLLGCRCRVVITEVDLNTRQLIAGREQARSVNVLHQTVVNSVEWLFKEVATERAAVEAEAGQSGAPPGEINLATCLERVYAKTGRTTSRDGIMV